MMFELLLDVMDRSRLRDTNAECAIALLPSKVTRRVRYLCNLWFISRLRFLGLTPLCQESLHQNRQIVTVASLQNRSGSQPGFVQPPAEVCEIFLLQSHLRERISNEGIEAGRDQ